MRQHRLYAPRIVIAGVGQQLNFATGCFSFGSSVRLLVGVQAESLVEPGQNLTHPLAGRGFS